MKRQNNQRVSHIKTSAIGNLVQFYMMFNLNTVVHHQLKYS